MTANKIIAANFFSKMLGCLRTRTFDVPVIEGVRLMYLKIYYLAVYQLDWLNLCTFNDPELLNMLSLIHIYSAGRLYYNSVLYLHIFLHFRLVIYLLFD